MLWWVWWASLFLVLSGIWQLQSQWEDKVMITEGRQLLIPVRFFSQTMWTSGQSKSRSTKYCLMLSDVLRGADLADVDVKLKAKVLAYANINMCIMWALCIVIQIPTSCCFLITWVLPLNIILKKIGFPLFNNRHLSFFQQKWDICINYAETH